MSSAIDPFSNHPDLRDKISDPLTSFFRTFTVESVAERVKEMGLSTDWWHSDAEREAYRTEALQDHRDTDLWIFAYGSLMWDPAFQFEEIRRAHAPAYTRRFILRDVKGGRGTAEAPGLMAALDNGTGCDGLAFRISRENIEAETEIIFRREMVGPGYIPTFVDATLTDRNITALTFVANHAAEQIDGSLTRTQQIECVATGTGILGSSLEYLENIDDHFTTLGIVDEDVSSLLRETHAFISANGVTENE